MEKELPLVSIVTPSLNQGCFIEETILSVKNQTYPRIEHIIMDGGSTDNTLDVIKKYEGTYNMHWVSEPDNGMYEAINKGLRKAQGEILAYLNTDDLYLPWTVSVVVKYFNQHRETDLISGDMININLETGENNLEFHPKLNFRLLIKRTFSAQPTVFFRNSVIGKVGLFNEELKLVGDFEYMIRAAKQCNVSKIEEVLAIEREHSKTQHKKKWQQLLEESEHVRERHGPTKGSNKGFTRILDWLQSVWAARYMTMKFFLYHRVKANKSLTSDSLSYPWQSLIEFPGFHVVSWTNFFIIIIPFLNRKRKGNWFILDMENEVKSSTEGKQCA